VAAAGDVAVHDVDPGAVVELWLEMGWRPDLQDQLLAAIRSEHPNVLTGIPWDEQASQQWQDRYQAARDAAFDIGIIHERTKEMDLRGMSPGSGFDFDELARRGGRPEEVDSLAHFTTRMLLRDMTNTRADSEVMLGVPPGEVTTVPAFGSFQDFQTHTAVKAGQTSPDVAFVGARLLVPHDPEVPHIDLVKRAAEFAQSPHMRAHRQAYHRWRHDVFLSSRDARDAEAELEAAIQDCARALRRRRWRFRRPSRPVRQVPCSPLTCVLSAVTSREWCLVRVYRRSLTPA